MPRESSAPRARHDRRSPLGVALALACALPLGCDSVETSRDASSDTTGDDAGAPTLAAPPSAPTLLPCPEGWSSAVRDELGVCEPSPPDAESCEGPSFRRAGRSRCEAVDDACGTGPFPTGLDPARTIRFVRAGSSGGDGSERAPFGTIAEAIAAGGGPITLALSAGSYEGTIALSDDVEILGVCADRVVITGPSDAPGLRVRAGQRLRIEGVTMHTADLAILSGGTLVARRIAIEGAATAGIALIGGTLEAERVLVRDTRTASDGTFGRGISLEGEATGTLRDVVIERSRDRGLAISASVLEAEGLAIRDTTPNDLGAGGSSVDVVDAGRLTLRHAALEGSVNAGSLVNGGSEITLEDVVVRDVVPDPMGDDGMGLLVSHARAHLRRVLVERASSSGIVVHADAELDASDVVVLATRPSDGFASGIAALGGHVTLERAWIADTAWMGLLASDPGGSIDAHDLVVHRVEAREGIGEGIAAMAGGSILAERVEVSDTHALGVLGVGEGSTVSLTDARISRVHETATYGVGRGVEADVGAHVSLTRVEIDDVIETGIVSFGMLQPGTSVSLDRVRVTRVHERSCAHDGCPTEAGGSGVAAVFGGAITARELEVDGAPLCGVQVARGASLDVTSGTVRRSAIGACVQIDGYDLSRILDGVTFVDNARNLETTGVYVPSGAPSPL